MTTHRLSMESSKRGLKALYRGTVYGLQLLIWLLLGLYLAYKLFERQHMVDVLPASLEPTSVLLIDGESGVREGCGVAVWRMSAHTRLALHQDALGFLAQARQARGYSEPYYRFEPWQPSPVPDELNSDGGWLSLACASPSERLEQLINVAMQSPGSFYSIKPEGILLLIPAQGLIVFGYYG